MFIEILYEDLIRRRVPIEESGCLIRAGILAIIISAIDDKRPRLNGCRRVIEGIGKDFYYLLNWDGRYALDTRDESELIDFFKKEDPWGEHYTDHPDYACSVIVFEGARVSDERWKEALKIFNDEMH